MCMYIETSSAMKLDVSFNSGLTRSSKSDMRTLG